MAAFGFIGLGDRPRRHRGDRDVARRGAGGPARGRARCRRADARVRRDSAV
ncbi:MAG: hypothetical protein MZV63_18180 [Marinilabiliales bacterium]|nr:hypothetical protein [Marinilabiliales bacterium]